MPAISLDDPRVYLAAERNLLAWIRTGLSMMGFGFVVARFGLFLHELAAVKDLTVRAPGLSVWIGTVLIGLGVAVTLLAALRHLQIVRAMQRGENPAATHSTLGLATSFLLATIGVAMAAYLVFFSQYAS